MAKEKDLLMNVKTLHNLSTTELVITFLSLYELTDLTILTNRVNILSQEGQLNRQQLNQLRILKIFLNHLIPNEVQKAI